MSVEGEIVPVDDVPTDSTFLFRIRPTDAEVRQSPDRESGEIREAIMIRDDEGVVAGSTTANTSDTSNSTRDRVRRCATARSSAPTTCVLRV